MTEAIRVSQHSGFVSLCLNRPERKNALSLGLLRELSHALSTAIPSDTSAVIISGADGCFSAGADLADLSGTLTDLAVDDAIEEVTGKIRNLPVPVIAAIDGPCMGGAFDLALSCDHRIASAGAFFQVPATRLGLLYNPRSIVRMEHRLGRDTLFRLLVLGERFDATAALHAGMVSRIVAGPSYDAAEAVALAAGENIGSAVAATKGLLDAIERSDYDAPAWEAARRLLLSSAERQAAVAGAKKRRGLQP
jgi:enoyl-CoA hydratase/carnithine racemase